MNGLTCKSTETGCNNHDFHSLRYTLVAVCELEGHTDMSFGLWKRDTRWTRKSVAR